MRSSLQGDPVSDGLVPAELQAQLERHGQQHLLRWWGELSAVARQNLLDELRRIDFDGLQHLLQQTETFRERAERIARAKSPSRLIRQSSQHSDASAWLAARQSGLAALRGGAVAVVLVAGGQGTRLGFPGPKGLFPVGPLSGKSLFQLFAEQLRRRAQLAGHDIPLYLMTSAATHADTVAAFSSSANFGLPAGTVHFFQQGDMPAVDVATGKILLADKGNVAFSPNGHGGVLQALQQSGALDEMRQQGVEHLFYMQVDNPLVTLCDPAFLGFHLVAEAEMTTKVVAKTGPEEKMGVVVEIDGQQAVIEYSELPDELARQTAGDGTLRLWAGNTAVHFFNRSFLERVLAERHSLPWHRAHKPVPFVNKQGELVEPGEENAWKFEQFVFDLLPLARQPLVFESCRDEEFYPLKNRSGEFSPEEVRKHQSRRHAGWLRRAGWTVPADAVVEISPLIAVDEFDLPALPPRTLSAGEALYLEDGRPAP